jgi:hypothetical protein
MAVPARDFSRDSMLRKRSIFSSGGGIGSFGAAVDVFEAEDQEAPARWMKPKTRSCFDHRPL